MATVYTWHAGSAETIEGLSVDARGSAREQLADARGAAREPRSDVRAPETKRSSDVDARAGARERMDGDARAGARERMDGDARAGARERMDGDARAGARERMDGDARAGARERMDGDGRSGARERMDGDGRAGVRERMDGDGRAGAREPSGEGRGVARERGEVRSAARDRGRAEAPSAEVPDWSREYCLPMEWNPSRQLLRALRDYTRARERGGSLGLVRRKIAALRHRFWSVMTGAEIPLNSSRIEGGLLIPHPNGIVIHPEVVIGPNCLLFQQVTLGTGPRPGVPKLGGNIDVGPGAKILGGVSIGDHAIIGANAVVLNDVAPGSVVVGVPATPKRAPIRQRDGA